MEDESSQAQIEHSVSPIESGEIHSWVRSGVEIARVKVTDSDSSFPSIEFAIEEDVVPYYDDDDTNALDEIGSMSMYTDMEIEVIDGKFQGSMRCSHNASLGPADFLRSVEGWLKSN